MSVLASVAQDWRERAALARLSLRAVGGRRPWLVALAPILWPLFHKTVQLFGGEPSSPEGAQSWLIGLPLAVLAIALGARLIAGEIDARTIEIAYTVPGGARRLWLARFAAAAAILLAADLALGAVVFLALTAFSWGALYGAFQGALFHLALAAGFGALFRGVITGAMGTAPVLVLSLLSEGGGFRLSPFFNPARLTEFDAADVLAWTVQNRIGMALAIAGLIALALARAERREKMLG